MKEKKENKDSEKKTESTTKKKTKKSTIIVSTIVSIISAGVGVIGGYVLYNSVNPEQQDIVIEKDKTYDKAKIEKALSDNTLAEDFKDSAYDIINYSCDMYASSPYSLTLGNGVVQAAAGVKQSILSATYSYPEGAFNQKVSSSSIVNTADRYYDENNNSVLAYECKTEDDWKKDGIESKNYTYDQYIQSFGKLLHGTYYCVDKSDVSDEEPIPEAFLTLNKDEYDASTDQTKHKRSGVIGYSLTKKSVTQAKIKKTEKGYTIELDLNINYAVSYVQVQMKTTGRLKARPQFSSCTLTFDLDDKLNLSASIFHDEYRVNTGGLVTNAISDLNQVYFTSESNTIENNGKSVSVKVPAMNEDFNGYELLN